MDFNLPELEVEVLKCRENELFHWLNHLNATVAYIAKDYASKHNNNNDDVVRLDKEVQKIQGHIDQVGQIIEDNKRTAENVRVLSELATTHYTNLKSENDTLRGEVTTLRQQLELVNVTIASLTERITKIEQKENA